MRAPYLADVIALESEPVVKLLEALLPRVSAPRPGQRCRPRGPAGPCHGRRPRQSGRTVRRRASDRVARQCLCGSADRGGVRSRHGPARADPASHPKGSTAGTIGGYLFHAAPADARIVDVDVSSPLPGRVDVSFLAIGDDGRPTAAPTAAITAILTADDIRPLPTRSWSLRPSSSPSRSRLPSP